MGLTTINCTVGSNGLDKHNNTRLQLKTPPFLAPQEPCFASQFQMLDGSGSFGSLLDVGSGANTFVLHTSPTQSTQNSLGQILSTISTTFCLNKEQLADCLLVSRKTLYNWQDGTSKPQQANIERLYQLQRLCQDWQYRKLTLNKLELSKAIIKNKSLLDLLKSKKLDIELILFAGSRLGFGNIAKPLADPFA